MSHVQRHQVKAQMQGRGSDQQVWEVDAYTLPHLLAVNAPSQLCNFQRQWIYGNGSIELFDEGFSPPKVSFCFGPVYAVRQFNGGHNRERRNSFSSHRLHTLENLPHRVPAMFACNQ